MAKRKPFNLNQISVGWNLVFTIVLTLVSLLIIAPMVLIVIISFSTEMSIARNGYSFMPSEWTTQGYEYLFQMGDQVLASYIITIEHTVLGTAMSLFVMTMYAYVLAQKTFRHRTFFVWILFFTMLFSGGLVPSYILNTRYLHLDDTIWIFLLPGLVSAYDVIILRTFIQTTIPDSLLEAARIDGAGHYRVYVNIVLPLFKAGIATIALFNVVGRWNNWFTGMLYVRNPDLVPLQTMLKNLQDNIDFLKKNTEVTATPEGMEMIKNLPSENLRMACTMIVILPILCAYPFFQRFFVQGLTLGSVKG